MPRPLPDTNPNASLQRDGRPQTACAWLLLAVTSATGACAGPTSGQAGPSAGGTAPSASADAAAAQPDAGPRQTIADSVGADELVATWGVGWNLGNSLDAPEGETAWGNPPATAELLQAVAAQGFDVVRVPVTWSLFLGPGPDYVIDPARLQRVREVVGYVMDAGMDAIINVHHDGADGYSGVEWITLTDENGAVDEATNARVEAQFVRVWTQLAAHFSDIGPGLLFESLNEIHDGYDAPKPGYYSAINHLNQVFVDTVRTLGGVNAKRNLIVPGYNTNIDYTLEGFVRPVDATADRLILSVHFYDPWSFAGEGSSPAWGQGEAGADSWGQEGFVVTQFDRLRRQYTDAGLPVIIGEYGAVNQSGAEDYRRYYMQYVTQAACQRGLVPIYWDNGGAGVGPDNFALLDRTTQAVLFPEILNAIFEGCSSDAPLDSIPSPVSP